jgi:hypothetical protein
VAAIAPTGSGPSGPIRCAGWSTRYPTRSTRSSAPGAADLTDGYAAGPLAAFQERQPFDRICVEYPALEQARFPLSGVRPGVVVSPGPVDVRTPELESIDEIVSRVDSSAAKLDIDDIALSTNGSFSAGSGLTGNQERLKRWLVEMAARYYWGNEL